jgi:hypothetical protein
MMNQSKLPLKIILPWFIVLLMSGCGSVEASSPPTSSISLTPLPTPSVYQNEYNFSFLYPEGWYYEESDEGLISIASKEHIQPMQNSYKNGEIVVEIINVLDTPSSGFGNPDKAIEVFTDTLGIKLPDQETIHNVNLNGKDFIIGTYSEKYINTAWRGNRAPIFIAVYSTGQNTIIVDLYAARNNETQLRKVFEEILLSIKDKP